MEIWILEISYWIISWLTYIYILMERLVTSICQQELTMLRTVKFLQNLIMSAIWVYILLITLVPGEPMDTPRGVTKIQIETFFFSSSVNSTAKFSIPISIFSQP